MIRNSYSHHPNFNQSTLNEPSEGFKSNIDFTKYPDMLACYEKLKPIFGENFILCNGCENAVRITLQVLTKLGIKNLGYAIPTWGMIDVYCSMFDIMPITKDFIYYEKDSIIKEPDLEADCIYSCNGKNNLFEYKL